MVVHTMAVLHGKDLNGAKVLLIFDVNKQMFLFVMIFRGVNWCFLKECRLFRKKKTCGAA
ncbi:MAG TPA: hypothetical protein DIW30_08360 [Bacteroidales bacterium]|nr:hypothetical protein [Bacteroidales bacterium]